MKIFYFDTHFGISTEVLTRGPMYLSAYQILTGFQVLGIVTISLGKILQYYFYFGNFVLKFFFFWGGRGGLCTMYEKSVVSAKIMSHKSVPYASMRFKVVQSYFSKILN